MAATQIPATQILDGSIKNTDIADDAAIAQSKIANLLTDLSNKQSLLPSQTGNSGKYLITNGSNMSWGTITLPIPVVNTSLTSLSIDCSVADIWRIPISANANFTLSNVSNNKEYLFRVKNTSASTITVSMPNSQIYTNQSVDIAASKARMFYLSTYSGVYEWLYTQELANV